MSWSWSVLRAAVVSAGMLVLLAGAGIAAERSEEIVFRVRQERGAALVEARAEIAAPPELVWRTLTDYDRFSDFVPGLLRSAVVAREGDTAIVEQRGEFRLLLLRIPIAVTLASTERQPHAIDVKAIRGDLRRLDGGYRIEEKGGDRVVLRWEGSIEPGWPMPPFVGAALLRPHMRAQFAGMVEEIRRRAGAGTVLPDEE